MAVLSIPAFTVPQAVWFKDPGLTLSQAPGIGPSSMHFIQSHCRRWPISCVFMPVPVGMWEQFLPKHLPLTTSLWVTKPLTNWAFVCWSLSYTKFPLKMDPLCLLSVTHGKLCLERAPFCACCNSASPSCTSFPLKMDPLFLLSVTLQTVCLEWAPFCACCNSASPSYTSLPLKRDLLLPKSGRKHYIQIWLWQLFAWYLNKWSTLGGSVASTDEETLMLWQEVRRRILVASAV